MGFLSLYEWAAVLIVIFLIYPFISIGKKHIRNVHSHWHRLFTNPPFSPLEFYNSLETVLKSKGIPGVQFQSVTHYEGGILSAKRLYLRIKFRDYIIDLCAAPFTKEAFFISWWLGDTGFTFHDFLRRLPFIGLLFRKRGKTFYELDTEIMFKELISMGVQETIEHLAEGKGIRLPDGIDWKPFDNQFKQS
jgi:hypothetical protein